MNDCNVVEIYNEKVEYEKKYNDLLILFQTKAEVVVTITNGIYQIENSIRANKISLKDYILNSNLCQMLKSNNIKDYSINDLKKYIEMYSNQYQNDMYPYKLALELYEVLEEIEKNEKEKIEFEFNSLKTYFTRLQNINILDKNNIKSTYELIINDLKLGNYDKKTYDYLTIIFSDIFTFYLCGYKKLK